MHRERAQGLAMGGLGLLHAYVLEKRHMMQQFAVEATNIKQTHIQMGRDIQAQARRRVLHMESQGRDRVSSASQAHHCLTLTLVAQRHAMLQEEVLHRRMACAAARRQLTRVASAFGHPPMNAVEQAQISEYAVPISSAPHVLEPPPVAAAEQLDLSEYAVPISEDTRLLHLLRPPNWSGSIYDMEEAPTAPYLRRGVNPSEGWVRGIRPRKRSRSIYDLEERETAQLHRPGLTPSDGRERGKRPRRNTDI